MDSTQAKMLIVSLLGKSVGGWLVEEELGYGKSAVVMRATSGERTGALKVFHPELVERYGEEKQIARISRETGLIGSKHPNLVEIYAGGKCSETGHLFVVMELVPYRNLKSSIKDIPTTSIRSIIEQLASAAIFLEERGLVHRDIKPENIAISENYESIKLLDLGVLRPFAESNLTDIDQRPFIGTLRYSSPEFLQRKEEHSLEGWRALTVYQIGAVLYDLLMKREIFSEFSSPYSVLVEAVLKETPDVYGEDPDLVRLCRHCLTKNPGTRLELVSWNDFTTSTDANLTVEILRNRIKGRQLHFNDTSVTASIGAAELLRLQRKELQDLCSRLGAAIAIALNDLQCFPLRKSLEESSYDGCSCRLLIFFEKSSEIGLHQHLHVGFSLTLEDQNNGKPIYTLKACSSLAKDELSLHQFDISKKLITGDANEVINHSLLEAFFLKCLEAAYQQLDKSGSEIESSQVVLDTIK
ncbi:serine/threonine protein kinase [Massilia rhizosphaerae]|uniref:serine/threonine protein kinase n=1 Tax=Massilia rhizosphaerae TaxID=2784389 RepID=UPI0018DC6D3A|nr:serine/threonine-protein kinase [Massilia rhizosphaerae]